jgi:hypothetical protein
MHRFVRFTVVVGSLVSALVSLPSIASAHDASPPYAQSSISAYSSRFYGPIAERRRLETERERAHQRACERLWRHGASAHRLHRMGCS